MSGEKGGKKTSVLFTIIILAMLSMALIVLFTAIWAYLKHNIIDVLSVILSAFTISLSVYFLIQMKRRVTVPDFDKTKVVTVVKCVSCDYSNTREFEKGDYILKTVGQCPKCNGTLLIHSIFKESQEEKKSGKDKFL